MKSTLYGAARRWSWGLLLLASGCIDPFNPKVNDANKNYLVVDGFINTKGASTIKLSRTMNLSSSGQAPAETRARLYIEDDNGGRVPLTETSTTPGTYTSPAQVLSPARKYRLHFYLSTGKEYASDYAKPVFTPGIDTVAWRPTNEGFVIEVSAHDDTDQVRHYRWSYDETWEFTSAHSSRLIYQNGQMVPRTEDIYRCWQSTSSSTIRLADITRLSEAKVNKLPLLSLTPRSMKLRIKYSLLVRQYGQTPEEYAYWDMLRKNTENIGTLFDPLPTQLTGNVHSLSDPDDLVLGYVGAYSVVEKRIFIARVDLPRDGRLYETGYEGCGPPDTVNLPDVRNFFANPDRIPLTEAYYPSGPLRGYLSSSRGCVDCRLRGTNVRPSFWR